MTWLLLLPGLALVASRPDFARRGRDLSVLGVGKLKPDNVAGEAYARRSRNDLRPMIAAVEGMVKGTVGSASPDIRTGYGYGTEHRRRGPRLETRRRQPR